MPSTSWGVIYCPKEGSAKTHKRWLKIRKYLEHKGVVFDFVQSEGPGSVERLAAMMTRSGYRTIVVVGGDSALNHALNGIMRTPSPASSHPALGVIPNGFGNDFARYWGMQAADYKQTIDRLIYRHTRKIDVGRIRFAVPEGDAETHYFINCLHLGVAASITRLRRRTHSICSFKALSYLFAACCLLFKKMNFKYQFRLNGEVEKRSGMTLCVGSARGYGLTPSAVPYNGMLDLTLVKTPLTRQLLEGVWLLFTGHFLIHKGISVWRTSKVTFLHAAKTPLSVDGRSLTLTASTLEVDILHDEIDFLVPLHI